MAKVGRSVPETVRSEKLSSRSADKCGLSPVGRSSRGITVGALAAADGAGRMFSSPDGP